MFFTEFEHFIFSFSYFSQLFVEITCQEIVEKLIYCYMVLWIICLSISFLFPPSVFMFTSCSSFENDQFIELCGMAVYLCYFLFGSLVFYHPMDFIYHLKLEFMSSFSKFSHNFLSQNSALFCVFESLPELFTLL